MDEVRLGPSSGLDSGTAGTYYLDGFESRRSTYTLAPAAQRSGVGPLAGLLPGGRSHLAALRHSLRSQGRLLPQASQRNPGFFARLTTRMYRALAAAFLPGLAPAYAGVQPAASVLSAPPAGQTLQVPSGQAWKTYYSAGGLVAMREITAGGSVLYYLHQDHLGSTSLATNSSGAEVPNTRQSYYPFGAVRVEGSALPTDKTFTGQYADASTGLYFYNARYYSSAVGRFVSADTIVPEPGNPQAFNRYAYTLNNPIKYTDPTGHIEDDGCSTVGCGGGGVESQQYAANYYVMQGEAYTRSCQQGTGKACPTWGDVAQGAVALIGIASIPLEMIAGGYFGTGGYIVGNGIGNFLQGEPLDKGLNAQDGGLAFVSGMFTYGRSPWVAGLGTGGQYVAKQALSGEDVEAGELVRNVFVGTAAGHLGSRIAEGTKGVTSLLPQAAKQTADEILSPAVSDNLVSLVVSKIEEFVESFDYFEPPTDPDPNWVIWP